MNPQGSHQQSKIFPLIARDSGRCQNYSTTFGSMPRISPNLLNRSSSSPTGDSYYSYNVDSSYHKHLIPIGMGVGPRPDYITGTNRVGPGAYNPIPSAARPKSVLDGKEYATTTIKPRLPLTSFVAPPGSCSPGPAAYLLDAKLRPNRQKSEPHWSIGKRLQSSTDHNNYSILYATKPPQFRRTDNVRSTFGCSKRFDQKIDGTLSCAPDGKKYFQHNSTDREKTRIASFGYGTKIDFTKLLGGGGSGIGPGTYHPNFSVIGPNSSFDGSYRPIQNRFYLQKK